MYSLPEYRDEYTPEQLFGLADRTFFVAGMECCRKDFTLVRNSCIISSKSPPRLSCNPVHGDRAGSLWTLAVLVVQAVHSWAVSTTL